MVVSLPGNDIFFVDAIQRADQLHSGEMVAVEFGAHGLNLAAVEHAHQGGFDHVGEVVAQSDFIAAHGLSVMIEPAPAHFCAQVAGFAFIHPLRYRKNIAFQDLNGNSQQGGVVLNALAVAGA